MVIGNYAISPYAIALAAALVCSFFIVYILLHKQGVPGNYIGYSLFLNLVFILYGAKVYTIAISGFSVGIIAAGFSSMGGVIGLLSAAIVWGLIEREKRSIFVEAYVVVTPFMYAVAKIGCFLSGCCGGISYHGPLAVIYHNRVIQGGPYFPVQLLESIVFVMIFFIGFYMYGRNKSVYTIPVVVLLCSIGKYFLEYLRREHVGKVISANQMFCILFFIGAIIMTIRLQKKSSNGSLKAKELIAGNTKNTT